MNIVIAYLYYDLLDLYGESGNIKVLKHHLLNQGINPIIKLLTINDKLDFKKYDLVVISAGTEKNQMIALKHLIKYKNKIKKAINNNKFFLVTGNSIELFGRYIIDSNKKKHKALNIFNYSAKNASKRLVADALFVDKFSNEYIIGFQNQCCLLDNIDYPMFEVIKGFGVHNDYSKEGIHYKNFYATYLIGPLLVRNPTFALNFIKNLIKNLDKNFIFKDFDFALETQAYDSYFNLHYNKIPKIKSTINL